MKGRMLIWWVVVIGIDVSRRKVWVWRGWVCLFEEFNVVGRYCLLYGYFFFWILRELCVLMKYIVVLGEIFNFVVYVFVLVIFVIFFGVLLVLVGVVVGLYVFNEELGMLGKLGSVFCLIGVVIIVLYVFFDEDI